MAKLSACKIKLVMADTGRAYRRKAEHNVAVRSLPFCGLFVYEKALEN
jgi:hypothetical protein